VRPGDRPQRSGKSPPPSWCSSSRKGRTAGRQGLILLLERTPAEETGSHSLRREPSRDLRIFRGGNLQTAVSRKSELPDAQRLAPYDDRVYDAPSDGPGGGGRKSSPFSIGTTISPRLPGRGAGLSVPRPLPGIPARACAADLFPRGNVSSHREAAGILSESGQSRMPPSSYSVRATGGYAAPHPGGGGRSRFGRGERRTLLGLAAVHPRRRAGCGPVAPVLEGFLPLPAGPRGEPRLFREGLRRIPGADVRVGKIPLLGGGGGCTFWQRGTTCSSSNRWESTGSTAGRR